MKLEEQVCSLKLAKQLKELGVKQVSIFCWCDDSWKQNCGLKNNVAYWVEYNDGGCKEDADILSAFTVAELGEMLPRHLIQERPPKSFLIGYVDENIKHFETAKTEADARAKMLIYLLKNKLM